MSFKMLKGDDDAARIRSADGLLESMDRKVAALERKAAQEARVPHSFKTDLEEVKGILAAVCKHLGLEPKANTTTHDLVPAGEGD